MNKLRKIIACTLFAGLSGILYFLLATTTGLRYDIQLAAYFLPGELHIEKINGKLFSDFTLENISYRDSEIATQIKTVSLSWQPSQLLRGKLTISAITLQEAKITIIAASDNALNLNDYLPYVIIKTASIDHLTIIKQALLFQLYGSVGSKWDMHWDLTVPQLAGLIAQSQGALTSSGKISGPRMAPIIHAELSTKKLAYENKSIAYLTATANIIVQSNIDSTLTLAGKGIKSGNYSFKSFTAAAVGNITYVHDLLAGKLKLDLTQQHDIHIDFSLPHFSSLTNPDQKIVATIDAHSSELNWLSYFIQKIKNPRGEFEGHYSLSGTMSHPLLNGNSHLSKGQVYIPMAGITLNNIEFQSTVDSNKALDFNGNFKSGDGAAQIQGTIRLDQDDFPITLNLKGNHVQIVNLSEYKITASPDLTLNFVKSNLTLQGEIFIPQANITPKNFNSTVTLPDEVVIIDQPQLSTPLALSLQVDLKLGDKIFIDYKDLKAQITGNLKIVQTPGNPATATGELHTLHGQYLAYKKLLDIEQGRLIYTGNPLKNPGLDIRATSEMRAFNVTKNNTDITDTTSLNTEEKITVGANIKGTLHQPQLSFFSIPASLSQADILSYLLLGAPRAEASSAILMSQLSRFYPGGSTSSQFADKLQDKLGLTELSVENIQTYDPTQQAMTSTKSVVLGKRIGPHLSLHYSIGVFTPVSVFNLRYQYNKHWAIQSETSTIDNGADLLYQIERN